LVFENAPAGRNTGCRSFVNCARTLRLPHLPRVTHKCRDNMTPPAVDAVYTRACTGIKNGHTSVTVQNRTHAYMNFFHHKDLGNHLLQLYPKVVKNPVFNWGQTLVKYFILQFAFLVEFFRNV